MGNDKKLGLTNIILEIYQNLFFSSVHTNARMYMHAHVYVYEYNFLNKGYHQIEFFTK